MLASFLLRPSACFGPLKAGGVFLVSANEQPPEINVELALSTGLQSDRPARQGVGDEDRMLAVSDVSGAQHAPGFHLGIAQVLRCAPKFAWRGLVKLRRPLHGQSLVGTLLVEGAPPLIKAGLLFLTPKLPVDVQMEPLVRTVVLGTTRPSPFQINAQNHPPGREFAQSQHAGRARKG